MVMKRGSGFEVGSGCYICHICKKRTRSTGRGDNENLGMCADCYDICGLENSLSDGVISQEEFDAQVMTNEKGIKVWRK